MESQGMERFAIGDVITPIWGTTFYDLDCRPYRVRAGTLTHVLEAEAGPAWAFMDKVYAVTLLLPDGKIRWYRSMDPRYWQKVSTTA